MLQKSEKEKKEMKKETTKYNKTTLDLAEKKFWQIAEDSGLKEDYLFMTTLKRYQFQLKILSELERAIEDEGALVQKEYVKNRKNLYSNPAIKDYNATTNSANSTVKTLLSILSDHGIGVTNDDDDPLMSLINGGDSDGEQ